MNALIKKEFFDLINKLNQSNKLKNQNIELYFYIGKSGLGVEKLFAAITCDQKILLGEKSQYGTWKPAYLSGFSNLEDCIADVLNVKKHESKLTDLIRSHIFKLE